MTIRDGRFVCVGPPPADRNGRRGRILRANRIGVNKKMTQLACTRRDIALEERVAIGKAPAGGRVDRKSKLIRGVKILGFHSRNPGAVLGKDFADMAGYDYDPAAIKQALPLYEGAPVNLDHLESKRDGNGMRVPEGSRHVKQRFGKLQNVRVESDGAYADIRYLDNHPLTPMVLEAAEEMPDVFTMSHHAHGEVDKGSENRGKVTKINQVHSVDLIAERPGTTTSLFESSPMDDDGAMTSEAAAQSNASTNVTAGHSGRRSQGSDSRGSFCEEVMAVCKSEDLDLPGTVFQELGAILQAGKKVERVAAFLAKAIKNWDLKNAKGEAVPHDGATLRKLPVTLYDRLQAIVFQLEASDSQPSHESSDESQSPEAGAPNS